MGTDIELFPEENIPDGRPGRKPGWTRMVRLRAPVFLTGAVVVIIFAGCLLYFSRYPKIWDISLWDESFFMAGGIYTWHGLSNYEWSPLYSCLYRTVHSFVSSPVDLFYTVGLVDVTSVLAAVYFATWRVSRSIFFATLVVCVLVLSQFPMVQPKVVYPAITILMTGAAIGFPMRIFFARSAVLALTMFLVTFIRPEFAVGYYLFSICAVFSCIWVMAGGQRRKSVFDSRRSELIAAAFAVLALVVLGIKWTVPVVRGGSRALMAFGQHYAFYWAQLNHAADPNAWFENFQPVLDKEFPGVTSEFQALLYSPGKMAHFFYYNVSSVLSAVQQSTIIFIKEHCLFAAAVVVTVVAAAAMKMPGAASPEHNTRAAAATAPWFHDAVLWLILALPTLISVVLIGAHLHYLIILTALVAMGLAVILRRRRVPSSPALALILALAFLLSVRPAPEVPRHSLDVVRALAKQPYLGRLLEMDGGWCFYVPGKCVPRYAHNIPGSTTYMTYLTEEHIDSIVVSDALTRFAAVRGQKAFLDFVSNPNAAGWKRVQLTPDVFLLRRDYDRGTFRVDMFWGNVLKFVSSVKLGDGCGTLSAMDEMTLFIHPGITLPTTFDLEAGQLARNTSCHRISLNGRMDPKISPEAVKRGGAVVGLTVSRAGTVAFSQEVSTRIGARFSMIPAENEIVEIKVDNHGNPDTDWFNLNI